MGGAPDFDRIGEALLIAAILIALAAFALGAGVAALIGWLL